MKRPTVPPHGFSYLSNVTFCGLLLTLSCEGIAANQAYDDFFGVACANPGGQFAQRCSEAQQSANGDFLSGESESSLNPSQALSSTDTIMDSVRKRSQRSDTSAAEASLGRWSMLVNARFAEQDSNRVQDEDTERAYKSDTRALTLGADYRASDRFVYGGMVGVDRGELAFDGENPGTNFTPAENIGDYKNNSTSFVGFAAFDISPHFYVNGNVGYISSNYEFHRQSVFQESGRSVPQTDVRTDGDTDGDSQWLALNLGLRGNRGLLTLDSYIGLTRIRSSIDSYDETDLNQSGLAMRFSDFDNDSLLGRAGAQASRSFNYTFGVLVPQLRVEFEHNYETDPEPVEAIFLEDLNQTVFRLETGKRDNNTLDIAVGLVAILPGGWMAYVEYDEHLNNDTFDRRRFKLGLRVEN